MQELVCLRHCAAFETNFSLHLWGWTPKYVVFHTYSPPVFHCCSVFSCRTVRAPSPQTWDEPWCREIFISTPGRYAAWVSTAPSHRGTKGVSWAREHPQMRLLCAKNENPSCATHFSNFPPNFPCMSFEYPKEKTPKADPVNFRIFPQFWNFPNFRNFLNRENSADHTSNYGGLPLKMPETCLKTPWDGNLPVKIEIQLRIKGAPICPFLGLTSL